MKRILINLKYHHVSSGEVINHIIDDLIADMIRNDQVHLVDFVDNF